MGSRPTCSARSVKTQYTVAALIPALIVTASISGFVWAQKQATIVVDGQTKAVRTQAADVAAVLAQAGVAVHAGDVVCPAPSTPVTRGVIITVRHAKLVTLLLGGSRSSVAVVGDTVADALVAAGVDPAANPLVKPALSEKLIAGMTITAPRMFARVRGQAVRLPFARRVVSDPSLPRGVRQVVSHGQAGSELRVYRAYVADGVEGSATLSAVRTVEPAVDEVVAVGTASRHRANRLIAASARVLARTCALEMQPPAPGTGTPMRCVATGYTSGEPGVDNWCATGARATHGVIAVDPNVIPLGTHVYVPGYGYAIAADTGGMIKGNHIDLCFDSGDRAVHWGRRPVTIIILD
jgi:uncharacterized protein YabE (DUF348 family)/3D (Asp-Asp-Asp) domain-containing protein